MNVLHRLALQAYRRYQELAGPGDDAPIAEQRARRERMWRPGQIRGTRIDDAPEVGGEWVMAPVAPTTVTVLWFHGGAYLHGSPRQRRGPASRLSQASGARVLNAAYRLAPEHPFPAALDDALGAYRWLLDLGVDADRLVVGGDSAGGGLAVSLLVALRDGGDPLPSGGVLFSPWTDLSLGGDSIASLADDDDVLDLESLRLAAERYLGGRDPQDPGPSPLFAELSGLPPLFIQPGGSEILLDDSRHLAERVREAGGTAVYDVWPGMPHVFQNLAPIIPEAGRALWAAGLFVRRVTGTG
jgi:acetyl esterase/lipase